MDTAFNRQSLASVFMIFSLIAFAPCALGHHPHDLVDALATSPSYKDDNTVYMASSGHVFKSVNGGYGWKELVNGLDHTSAVSSIAITTAGNTSGVILVSTLGNGIYRSMNNGASWQNSSSGLENLEIKTLLSGSSGIVLAIDSTGRLYTSADGGETWVTAILPEGTVITAATASANRILAGDSIGRLYSSADNGMHWENSARLAAETAITTISMDPSNSSGDAFYVGTRDLGLYKTADNGGSFQQSGDELASHHIISLALHPDFMVATTWKEAAFISTDHGQTWTKYADGLLTDEQANTVKYRSPQFRQIAITGDDNQTIFLAGFAGLFKSTNGGHNWKELETLPVSLIKGLDVSPSRNDGYSIAITTYGGGAYFSHDQGESWIIANKGLNTTRLMSIHYSPAYPDDQTLFSGSVGLLLKSTDRNGSWQQIPLKYNSLKKKIIYKLRRWGLPKNTGQSYLDKVEKVPVYPVIITPSPDYASDKTVLFGTRWHGLYRSEDDGLNAVNVWLHTDGAITVLSLSPDFSNDHSVFAYVRNDGIYKSTDRGDSWQQITQGLPPDATSGTKAGNHSAHGDYTVVFSPGYANDGTVFAAGPSGLFKSTDQGESWNELKDDTLGKNPHIIAFALSPDYLNDRTILVSLKGRGLYRSADNGQSFISTGRNLIENNNSITRIAFTSDYSANKTIYAASSQDLYRSSDGGDSWTLIQRPVRYEDHRDVIHYKGHWTQIMDPDYSASTVHYSDEAGATVSLDFFGCGVRWVASKSPQGGTAKVSIDGSVTDSVDLRSDQRQSMAVVFSRTGLSCGPHSISVVVNAGDTASSTEQRITFDAFDILPEKQVINAVSR